MEKNGQVLGYRGQVKLLMGVRVHGEKRFLSQGLHVGGPGHLGHPKKLKHQGGKEGAQNMTAESKKLGKWG